MHYFRNIEIRIKTKIKQTWGLTEIATLKFRSKGNPPVTPDRPDQRQPGMGVSNQPPVLLVSKVKDGTVIQSEAWPTVVSKEVSKAVNLDWINNQACRVFQNIYVITNLFITNMIRNIIFTNYFSEFIHQVSIKSRFWKALQKKCFQSDIIFKQYVKMPPIKFILKTPYEFYDIYTLVWEVLLSKPHYEY